MSSPPPNRSVPKRLLSLRKEVPFSGATDSQPFCLSLRKLSEFSDVHSFGLLKVPHIGVYGDEYAVCSPIILLSLPSSPKCLRSLPPDLLGALDLNEIVEKEFPRAFHNAMEVVSGGCISDQESAIVEISRAIVKQVIEEAMLRVDGGKLDNLTPDPSGRQESMLDVPGSSDSPNTSYVTAEEAWAVPQLTVKDESDLEDGSTEENDLNGEEAFECLPSTDRRMCHSSEDEIQSMARRVVLKSIQAACNEVSARHQLSGSIECLISSTKRMKIESPPPPFVPSFSAATTKNPKGFHDTDLDTPTKSINERALTPESLRREKQWKKRGRSESHEVSCLLDYDVERSKYRSTSVRELDKGVGNRDKSIPEEYDTDEDCDTLNTIVTNLTKLSLRHHNRRMNAHKEGYSSDCNRSDLPGNPDRHVRFTVYSPLLKDRQVSSCHKCVHSPSLSPRHSLISMETQSSDIRIALYENSMPEVDFFFMVHTCPPPGLCQKFTCSNYNEINLLFHCWLFKDAPCDPSVTVSAKLEMGVFKPKNVKPVHLDLLDAGVPFNYMEERSVVIHECRFSPENAQLQLEVNKDTCNPGTSCTYPFHSFFSSARQGDRKVITYHILPSTSDLEHALREVTQNCDTLGHLLSMLGASFPEIRNAISSFILSL